MVGTRTWALPCKAAPKASAFSSPVMYSSQPEESTSTSSEAVIAIAVVILPLHSFGDPTQLLDRARLAVVDAPVHHINEEFLAGQEVKFFADSLRDDDLKFWGNLYFLHLATFSHKHSIDGKIVCQVVYRSRIRMTSNQAPAVNRSNSANLRHS